jgi:hypothetical protein
MPFKKRISDMTRAIEQLQAEVSGLRAQRKKPGDSPRIEKRLALLARLKAERIRLMEKQRLTEDATKKAVAGLIPRRLDQ